MDTTGVQRVIPRPIVIQPDNPSIQQRLLKPFAEKHPQLGGASEVASSGTAVGLTAVSTIRRFLLVLLTAAGLALGPSAAFADQPVTETLNPPPPSFLTCNTVGGGTICMGSETVTYGPDNTGITCGSGATAFNIFDSGTFEQRVIRFYDSDGNLTRRTIHIKEIGGEWSNPLTGATVSYTQTTSTSMCSPSPATSPAPPRRPRVRSLSALVRELRC